MNTFDQEIPLACDMSKMSKTQRERYNELAQILETRRQAVHELADGFALVFPSNTETQVAVAEFMSLEHLCCPFLRLTMGVEPGGSTLTFSLTGSGEAKAVIRSELFGD